MLFNLQNITKCYKSEHVETTALNAIDLTVNKGEFLAIMGPSGCGKSTLLNIIGMLDSIDHGSYNFAGQNIAGQSEATLATIRKKNIGFIFQSFNLIDELTVRENIELALLYTDIPASDRRSRVTTVMEKMAISHRADHFPSQLSGGQQQRVAVARAVVGKQDIILADEPTGNLDTEHGREVMEMLQALNREGTTVIMVTHSPDHAQYASRIVKLLDGKIIDDGHKSDADAPARHTEAAE